jgi:hypothetical protein
MSNQFPTSGKHPVSFGLATPKQIRDMIAYHESRHTDTEPDDISVAILSDDFLQDMERNGTRRAIMHDLGFNMEKDAAPVEHVPLDLGKGYATFDRTIVRDADGLSRPRGYQIRKGRGKGHIFIQGDKHGEA